MIKYMNNTTYDFYDTRIVTEVTFNWHQVIDGNEAGESWDRHTVGKNDVVSIHEHCTAGEGDKWFFDVVFADGNKARIFNPNYVKYQPPLKK